MDGGRHVAALAALLAWCCVQGFLVDVAPRRPLLLLGERRRLVCAAQDCPSPPHVAWTSPGDRPLDAAVTTEGTSAAVTFDPVTVDHQGVLQCQVVCGEEAKHVTVRVQVYDFPSPPVVSGQDLLRWGSEAVLTCRVPGIYPEDRLLLTWVRDDRVLQTGPPESPELGSWYRFTPSLEDSGANVTCRAELDLQDQQSHLPPFNWTRETTITLHPLSPPTSSSLQILPGSDVLEGDHVTFSCQSHGAPPPTLVLKREGMELQRTDPTSSSSSSSLTFNISSVALENSAHYTCQAANELGSQVVSQSLVVRAHPLQVEASPQIAADRGSAVVLVCRASGCPDPPDLVWTWTDWDHDSQNHDSQNQDSQDQDSQDSQVQDGRTVLRLQDLALDQQRVYACRAQCGGVIREKLVQVYVYSFPLDPVLSGPVPSPVLIGREAELRCDVIDVFSSNQASVRWLQGDRVLVSESFRFTGSMRNLSLVLRYQVDHVDLDFDQNWDLVLTCSAQVLDQNGDVWRIRETRIHLDLQSPPTNSSLQIFPGSDVLEGDHVTFSCQSDGAPPPTLVLKREGTELQRIDPASSSSSLAFIISSVALEDSAQYTCQAANQHGSKMEAVSLRVRAPPRNTTVTILPSDVVRSGLNVTVRCRSVSSPPAAVTLTRLADGTQHLSDEGDFLLVAVGDRDSGLYRVNASNRLGYQVQVFRLKVTGPGPGPSRVLLVVPAVCSLAVLLAAALIMEYLRRSRKKGFYQLALQASSS